MPQTVMSSSPREFDLAIALQPSESSSPFPMWSAYTPALCSCCLSSQRSEKTWRDIAWCDLLAHSSSVLATDDSVRASRPSTSAGTVTASVSGMVSTILATLGLTKTQLASALGLSRQAIYGWLKGAEPSPAHFERISCLARMVEDVCQETRRPLYRRFVFNSIVEDLPSIIDILQQVPWDSDVLASALREARRLTSERDRGIARRRQGSNVRQRLNEQEQSQNLEDNLFMLD